MDILKAVAIELPCNACGRRRTVTLQQIRLSQEVLEVEGCRSLHGETECPPMYFAPLVDHALLDDLARVWQRLEERARVAGGQLSLSGEDQT